MGISDSIQTLVAAFSFGTLFQAVAPAIFLFAKGHGKVIFKDGRRLVLVLFLFFAALWAQIEFLSLLLPTTMAGPCSAAVIISTLLDQLVRVLMEQFLLWSVGHGTKMTTERFALQGILLLRLIAGGLLVGFTRTNFAPTCVARTSVLPIGIIVLSLDVVIFAVLVARSMSLGLFNNMGDKASSKRQQSQALVFTLLGFGLWTAISIPMILGIPSIILVLRTVLPANGLLILANIVVAFSITLFIAKEDAIIPEARSPFMNPMPPTREIFNENITNSGSPIAGSGYTKSSSLFIVNPSTPNESPSIIFPGSTRSGDTKGFTKLSAEVTVTDVNTPPARPERTNLLQVKRGPGYRGSSGIFPHTLAQGDDQGALAPYIRPTFPEQTKDLPPLTQQKRSLFSRSPKLPLTNVRSLGISQPMPLDAQASTSQPFAKIQTIDLATAAQIDRERRQEAYERSRMIASRPAPPPPTISAQEAVRESKNIRRKEAPLLTSKPMPSIPASKSGGLGDQTNGNSTSASLSPGREEIRRRSPRSGNGFNETINSNGNPPPMLQRKGTIGLPSNPRSQRMTMAREVNVAKEQTVMLINEIVYNNPAVVNTIMNAAPSVYGIGSQIIEKSSFSPDTSLQSSNSVLHRPRPYKRTDSNKDRQIFPSEASPGHRRNKSTSSFTTTKSILRSLPGSPTNLPPLPAPPTTADKLTKLLPNNTKSMTFDEKIHLMFPAPPGPANLQYRRSSVPSLPRVPSVFMADSPTTSPTETDQRSHMTSRRTTLASFGFDDPYIAPSSPNQTLNRDTYRFSAATHRTFADENSKRQKSMIPVIDRPTRQSVFEDLTNSRSMKGITRNHSSTDDKIMPPDSIISNISLVNGFGPKRPSKASAMQSTYAQKSLEATNIAVRPFALENRRSRETVPVVLDLEEPRRSFLLNASANSETFFLDDGQGSSTRNVPEREPTWHKRIGDDLPTFSERTKRRSRNMPPPTPLLLSKTGRKATVLVRAEPSPPRDSPERAIREIQEQLKRFEDPKRGSVDSVLERLPNANIEFDKIHDSDRLRLLDNLEMEMGQQENQWQQMQTNLDRDSMSLDTPTAQDNNLSRESSDRSSRPPSRVIDRRSLFKSGMSVRSKSDNSARDVSSDSSENSRASIWQQRLADAQMEYTAKAPSLRRKNSLNFFSVHNAQPTPGSLTPPESLDSEADTESQSDNESLLGGREAQRTQKKVASLWQQPTSSPKAAAGRLWNVPVQISIADESPEPPAKDLRPVQRRSDGALQIFSADLWSKPRSSDCSRPVLGLWRSNVMRPKAILPRPVTQRPARKSKRVTFLPDIVENPVPLPDKRDTLGIFQFPWGEKSDQAVYKPSFVPSLLPVPMLNSQLEARSRQLEPEQSEYSSSFFDDYEEEEDEDEMIDVDSDDDFDETTLWEIASLLKSSEVPSSFSSDATAPIEDYGFGLDDHHNQRDSPEIAGVNGANQAKVLQMRLPIQPLAMPSRKSPRSSLEAPISSLWVAPRQAIEPPQKGLFSKSTTAIHTLVRTTSATPATMHMLKAPRKPTGDLQILASRNLWSPIIILKQEPVWIMSGVLTSAVVDNGVSTLLWFPAFKVQEVETKGLFDAGLPRLSYRTTQATPAALSMICKSRKSQLPLASLHSCQLWSSTQKLSVGSGVERDWISESSVRPVSPSIYSSSSSFVSSPVSDVSSIKSTSTKASSNWGFSAIPSWWESKKSKLASPPSPAEDVKPISKIPVNQPPKALAPIRESRVLASRDMWGAKALTLEKSLPKKSFKVTVPKQVSKPSRQVMRQQYRQNGTFQCDWDEALAEAIAASQIKPALKVASLSSKIVKPVIMTSKVPRPTVSKAEWDIALARAVSLSQPRLERPKCTRAMWEAALSTAIAVSTTLEVNKSSKYDPAVTHPAFFTKRLVSNITDIHPATIGHVSRDYNPAIMHPVFFVESMVSKVVDVHPAAISHFAMKKAVASGMWSPEKIAAPLESGLLWTNSAIASSRRTTALKFDTPLIRKTTSTKMVDLEVLISTSLWEPLSAAPAFEKNWLATGNSAAKAQPSVQVWTASKTPSADEQSGRMWAPTLTKTASILDLFAHLKHNNITARPSRLESLETLTSSSLFQKPLSTSTNIDWLHHTSKSFQSATWIVPTSSSTEPHVGMWRSAPQQTFAPLDLFTNIMDGSSRAKYSYSQSVALPGLVSSELFKATIVSASSTHWLHQTSKGKQSLTWAAPAKAQASKQQKVGMWTPAPKSAPSTPDLVVHITSNNIRSKAPSAAPLPKITSTSLFTPTKSTAAPTHWLHQTSKTTPVTSTRKRSLTWTARAPLQLAPKETNSLWVSEPSMARSIPSPMMFPNTHSEPWTRVKRSDSGVSAGGIESAELWQAKEDVNESEKNWIDGDKM